MCEPNSYINTLRPRQNGRRFADDTFKRIFLNENVRIFIKISLKFFPRGPINNNPALVQIMAWRRPGDKPLSEPMMVSLLTHICVTRPQSVKWCLNQQIEGQLYVLSVSAIYSLPLQWRHNGRDDVSNHQPHDRLLNRLFRCRSKKTAKLYVNGLCVGNSPVTGEFPAQRTSNAENVSIWWRHHVKDLRTAIACITAYCLLRWRSNRLKGHSSLPTKAYPFSQKKGYFSMRGANSRNQ